MRWVGGGIHSRPHPPKREWEAPQRKQLYGEERTERGGNMTPSALSYSCFYSDVTAVPPTHTHTPHTHTPHR